MVVEKVNYIKFFLSKTNYGNSECHKITQDTSEEDDAIRKEIIDFCSAGLGFDGKQLYDCYVFGKPNAPLNSSENVTYITKCFITKRGALEEISKTCELEDFLLKKGFEKVEEEN